jgi:hypothetical protein
LPAALLVWRDLPERFGPWKSFDTKARPLYITLTLGQRHEMVAALDLLSHANDKALIGDTSYDSNQALPSHRHT